MATPSTSSQRSSSGRPSRKLRNSSTDMRGWGRIDTPAMPSSYVVPSISRQRPRGPPALRRHRFALRLYLGGVVVHQLLGDGAGRKPPMRDLGDSRHFGGAAGDEALGEAGELI